MNRVTAGVFGFSETGGSGGFASLLAYIEWPVEVPAYRGQVELQKSLTIGGKPFTAIVTLYSYMHCQFRWNCTTRCLYVLERDFRAIRSGGITQKFAYRCWENESLQILQVELLKFLPIGNANSVRVSVSDRIASTAAYILWETSSNGETCGIKNSQSNITGVSVTEMCRMMELCIDKWSYEVEKRSLRPKVSNYSDLLTDYTCLELTKTSFLASIQKRGAYSSFCDASNCKLDKRLSLIHI